jgi:hypothetical protein
MNMQRKQKGASAIGLIIMLAILGYGIFVGLQYIPQHMESGTVNSILDSIEANHKATPVRSVNEITGAINRHLDVNRMNDMQDKFYVTRNGGTYTIEVSYERELNLVYQKKLMKYEKTLTLR